MSQRLDEEVRSENKIVASWLLWYPDRKAEYEKKREAVLHSSPPGLQEVIHVDGGKLADSTGNKAARLADLDPRTAKWLALVEEVERRLPWKMRIFLRLRWELRHYRGRRGWTVAMQHRYAEEVAKHLGKPEEECWVEDRTTFWRWWVRIVEYAARLAAKAGLLNENGEEVQSEQD